MPPSNPKDSVEFLLGTLVSQGKTTHDKLEELKREVHEGLSGLTKRVSVLEHDRTKRKAALAAVAFLVSFLTTLGFKLPEIFNGR